MEPLLLYELFRVDFEYFKTFFQTIYKSKENKETIVLFYDLLHKQYVRKKIKFSVLFCK